MRKNRELSRTAPRRAAGGALPRAAFKVIAVCVLLFPPRTLFALPLPPSFFVFRDAVYSRETESPPIEWLYAQAKDDAEKNLSGVELFLALARCEYLMGISIRAEDNKREAAPYFEQGIVWAEKSIELRPTSEGHRLLGTNIAFLSESRIFYGLGNFRKIEANGRRALELDPRNLTAAHLVAAWYVLAPWPLGSTRKGRALLEEITARNYLDMEKEDLFNLYLIFELACLKQRKNLEAQIWSERAKAIYPENNFMRLLDRWGFIDGNPYGIAIEQAGAE